jgi:hypothetical protein
VFTVAWAIVVVRLGVVDGVRCGGSST